MFKKIWGLLKQTFSEWSEDKAPRLAAALSYYTVFSIAPFLVIVIAIIGLIFGRTNAENSIMTQIEGMVGEGGAQAIQTMIAGASQTGSNILAAVIGVVLLLFGAGGLFGQLQDALNTIWEVKPKPNRGILGLVKDRFFSFTMVLGVAFLLLASLVVSAALSALGNYMTSLLPGLEVVMQVVNFLVSFAVITLLFALIFKVLPDAKIAWKDVWLGAAVTALLFEIGKFAIGMYLGRGNYTSTYGAAASLVIILLWVYYIGQILFFGAEFTQVYANTYGSRIVPEAGAQKVTEEDRAQQGIPHEEQEDRQPPAPRPAQPLPQTGVSARPAPWPTQPPQPTPAALEPLPEVPPSPADRGIQALGGLLLSLVGVSGSLLAASRFTKPEKPAPRTRRKKRGGLFSKR